MLFRKDIEKHCAWCRHGSAAEEGFVVCLKHGIKRESDACRSFSYDPLKRVPPRPKQVDFTALKDEDFTL